MSAMTPERLLEFGRYLQSGNAVPVSRVTMPAADLRELLDEVQRLRGIAVDARTLAERLDRAALRPGSDLHLAVLSFLEKAKP